VVAIHLGVDHDRLHPDGDAEDAAALAALNLPPPPWLYYPAALWPHKNHERLLTALADTPPDLSLVLSGSDVGRGDALRATAARLGVAARIRELCWVSHDAVPALYRAATGVVYPSLAEGFGMPPVEAMACGTPAAASAAPAIAEACGGAALTFDPRDVDAMTGAMSRLATDERLRRELRQAGLERARALTWRASAERHAEVYEDAARG
jgi:glycosyltransferase involved in cell wall biosynthesis